MSHMIVLVVNPAQCLTQLLEVAIEGYFLLGTVSSVQRFLRFVIKIANLRVQQLRFNFHNLFLEREQM